MRRGAILSAIILAIACDPYEVDVAELPGVLSPPPGAKISVSRASGADATIVYEYGELYPAGNLLAHIHNQISEQWRPRVEDYLNPGIPTSHVRGWVDHGDLTTRPPSWVHQWSAEWQNEDGDILSYSLIYRSPGATEAIERPTTTLVTVFGSVTSHEEMESTRNATGSKKPAIDENVESRANQPPAAIVNPEYLVLRAVRTAGGAGLTAARTRHQTVYFDPSDRILDLRHLNPETAHVVRSDLGEYAVFIDTTEQGDRLLRTWTSQNVGSQLGVFLDGELVAVPVINTPLSGTVLIESDFTEGEAEHVRERLNRGGGGS